MDPFLIDYLKSGKAWLLVGSGPSAAMGYPTWGSQARDALALAETEAQGRDTSKIRVALDRREYPSVFEETASLVGADRLIQHLRERLRPTSPGRIYESIAKWPVPVYLTTNFDHELTTHLARVGQPYISYSNTPDHLSLLLPEASGIVTYLHGDLRSEVGLILMQSQYDAIRSGADWQHWRTKITSIFQMNRVVILGHSLTDPHVRHVLEAAKAGAGIERPVCWIAPDVDPATCRDYLQRFRIRVISYDNKDGTHRNLVRLVESISDFVPPRESVRISRAIERVSESPLEINAAAPGFFVFNKLSAAVDFESKRVQIVLAAIRAALPRLVAEERFSLQHALELAGWPAASPLVGPLADLVNAAVVTEGVLIPRDGDFSIAPLAIIAAKEEKDRFDHLRALFQLSLENRLRRTFPSLGPAEVSGVAADICAALSGYFREGGLTLASTLSGGADRPAATVPSSILQFVNLASARYPDYLRRQAFSTVSIDCFVRSEAAEREFLGRISQGFFAFHALGVFGDAARERLAHATQTVWLVDSSAQIPTIALASPAYSVFSSTFSRVTALGLRLFTTDRLMDETRAHLWFADRIVSENGPISTAVIAAAMGSTPYRKANVFLEGFINWQAAGNPADWGRYLVAISGQTDVGAEAVRAALMRAGINSVPFGHWPGFEDPDFAEADATTTGVVSEYEKRIGERGTEQDFEQKARPEAEAMIVVRSERRGKYHMLSEPGDKSPAWFLSETSILNALEPGLRITWQPEAFIRFAATLNPPAGQDAADQAFEMLVWSLAQAGVSVLEDRLAVTVFGGVIDQAGLTIALEHDAYERALAEKYGEPVENVLRRLPAIQQPLAALQLANERAEVEAAKRNAAEIQVAQARAAAAEALKRAAVAEKKLGAVEKFRRKQEQKQKRSLRRTRKSKSGKKRKKR